MRNAIEVAAYIRVNDLSMTSVNQLVDVPYGIQCTAVSPIGILFRLQVGLENRFEYQHRRRLRNPIADGRYSQRPLLPVRLGYVYSPHRFRLVASTFQRLRQFVQPSLRPVRLNVDRKS